MRETRPFTGALAAAWERGPLTEAGAAADDCGPLTDAGAAAEDCGPLTDGGVGVAGGATGAASSAEPRPVSASIARRKMPGFSTCSGTTMSATGTATEVAGTLPRAARCMRGRTGSDTGAVSRRRSSNLTGAGRSPPAARAGVADSPPRNDAGRALRMIEGPCTLGLPVSATGSEWAEPAGLRATRLRCPEGEDGGTSAPGTGGSVGSAASRATAGVGGGTGSGEPDPRPSTMRAPRLRWSFERPPPCCVEPGLAASWTAASADIAIAFSASPPRIQAACQSAIPTGVASPLAVGAGGGAGASAALRAIASTGSLAGAPGRGGLSLVAARSTRAGARAAATSPPRRPVAPRRAGLAASRTGGRPRREESSPLDVRSLGSISAV